MDRTDMSDTMNLAPDIAALPETYVPAQVACHGQLRALIRGTSSPNEADLASPSQCTATGNEYPRDNCPPF